LYGTLDEIFACKVNQIHKNTKVLDGVNIDYINKNTQNELTFFLFVRQRSELGRKVLVFIVSAGRVQALVLKI
jgi:hypothetical protein